MNFKRLLESVNEGGTKLIVIETVMETTKTIVSPVFE